MLRHHLLLINFLFSGQFAVGQNSIYGDYKGTQVVFGSIRHTIHLSLKKDGRYIMQSPRRDYLVTLTGNWRKKGDQIKLKKEYSKTNRSYGLARTYILDIEDDKLIWKPKPTENKNKLERSE